MGRRVGAWTSTGPPNSPRIWEPVPDCWNVRPRADGGPGTGPFTIDFAFQTPEPEPVTTIAWRLAHVIVGVLGMRAASHFGGPAMSYDTFRYAGSADEALGQLDQAYESWSGGVRKLSATGLNRPCGPAEGPFADYPLAALVLHINREVIHHGAEIALLRDLYLREALRRSIAVDPSR
ncbi:DinB family protein [Mycobacterium arosiense]|uniref:Serine/arginine repetitive matrix protein 1 n=1 Tax=Mycobacterium arosiense ATCC BAA-1401 = DSM 45069 TaxID=1265311 RepID=A0A1W9ZD50_MYCAI|nr:DinB family protein [Mycobacterium arosiense]ORA12497.1 serine/arginine repetitive matrix protein 1 [Mycobacterium arosiense ATCC BAA-1401 = DSM 45069]